MRVVLPSDDREAPEPVDMAEALSIVVKRVAAERPKIAVVIYETADGEIKLKPLPASVFVAKTLVAEAYALLHPNSDIAE